MIVGVVGAAVVLLLLWVASAAATVVSGRFGQLLSLVDWNGKSLEMVQLCRTLSEYVPPVQPTSGTSVTWKTHGSKRKNYDVDEGSSKRLSYDVEQNRTEESSGLMKKVADELLLIVPSEECSDLDILRASYVYDNLLMRKQMLPVLMFLQATSKDKEFSSEIQKQANGKKSAKPSKEEIETLNNVEAKDRHLIQRIPPKAFINMLKKGMSDNHKEAIRNIGFGGFLDLDIGWTSRGLFCAELVKIFDVAKKSLVFPSKEKIKFRPKDVHLVYGVPARGANIDVSKAADAENQAFFQKWRAQFGLTSGSPSNASLVKRIQDQTREAEVSDDFLLNFVVAAVNCCIRSTNNQSVYFKFLHCCKDISKINSYDWSSFTHQQLLVSVKEWKDGSTFFTSPLPFLMINYFDRMKRGNFPSPRQFPLILVWNQDLVKSRINIEQKKGYGNGVVMLRLKLEQDQPAQKARPAQEAGTAHEARPSQEAEKSAPKKKEFFEKFASNVDEIYKVWAAAQEAEGPAPSKEVFFEKSASNITEIYKVWAQTQEPGQSSLVVSPGKSPHDSPSRMSGPGQSSLVVSPGKSPPEPVVSPPEPGQSPPEPGQPPHDSPPRMPVVSAGKEKLNLSTTEIVSSSAHDTPSVVSSAHDTPLTIAYDTPSEQHLQVDEGMKQKKVKRKGSRTVNQ
uniref:Uncharacterized protein n=1 Tax=Chenopodium quinoa TaxID=63459 RepID=A0A803MW11_CHEQI